MKKPLPAGKRQCEGADYPIRSCQQGARKVRFVSRSGRAKKKDYSELLDSEFSSPPLLFLRIVGDRPEIDYSLASNESRSGRV